MQRSEQVFRPLIGPSSPGLSVIVLKEGKSVIEGSYGLANLEMLTHTAGLVDYEDTYSA